VPGGCPAQRLSVLVGENDHPNICFVTECTQ
jgi:hypothetical protein